MKITAKINNYFSTVVSETKKVIWPTREQTISNTLIVIVVVVVAALVFSLVDYGLTQLLIWYSSI